MFSSRDDLFKLVELFPDGAEDSRVTTNPVTWAEMVHLRAHDSLDINSSYPVMKTGIMGHLFGHPVYVARHAPSDACLLSWKQDGRHRIAFVCSSPRHGPWRVSEGVPHCRHDECCVDSVMSS